MIRKVDMYQCVCDGCGKTHVMMNWDILHG